MPAPLPIRFIDSTKKNLLIQEVIKKTERIEDPLVVVTSYDVANNVELVYNFMPNAIRRRFIDQRIGWIFSIQAIMSWLPTKQIYRFDKDFLEILKQTESDNMPVDVLTQAPFKSIFIEPLNCFVFFDLEDNKSRYNLGIVEIKDDLSIGNVALLPIVDAPVTRILDDMNQIVLDTIEELKSELGIDKVEHIKEDVRTAMYTDDKKEYIVSVLQALVYLCASNADIQEKPVVTRRSKKKRSKGSSAGIKEVEVGAVVMREFRQATRQGSGSSNETIERHSSNGWSQRPHLRRAHYHRFWTGKKSDPTSRKLISKWIKPVFVNLSADTKELPMVTVNIVKNAKKRDR